MTQIKVRLQWKNQRVSKTGKGVNVKMYYQYTAAVLYMFPEIPKTHLNWLVPRQSYTA
jgi:hypothetical protein